MNAAEQANALLAARVRFMTSGSPIANASLRYEN
jgi:hypothetical protein